MRITGIYRAFPSKANGHTSGMFRTVLIAEHVHRLLKAGNEIELSHSDVTAINNEVRKHTPMDEDNKPIGRVWDTPQILHTAFHYSRPNL